MSKVPASTIAQISALETRLMMAKLLVGGLIGLCAGALLGGLVFGALGSDTTATAFVRLKNPADLTAIAGGASQITPDNQDNTATFVAGEIAYLTGDGFSQAVARKMAMDEPAELNVAQANESPVVTISYSSSSREDAIRTVQTAIDLYRNELEQRVDAELRTILPRLAEWQRASAAEPARVQDIQRVRDSVELQAAEAGSLLVVQPPTPNHPSSQQWLIGAILGALVGGAGAVALLLARRRRSGHGSVVKNLTAGVDSVLLPTVDVDLPPRDAWGEEQARLARTLYAQCPGTGTDRVILVVGASPSSGAAEVARLLDSVAAPDGTRIVAGGAVGDPTLTPEALGDATALVLVARIEGDTTAQVLMLRALAAATAAPTAAVFTQRRQPARRPARRRAAESAR
ncbi:hypothetical protein ACNUDN_07640 [Mycobacterium sp. smrl_JER01]|uniref:hypothetical protein n=1 Tax=Mycobacterium sp. smrl_JER01 TaxID=3402633 RepID=UPI003AC95278